MIRYTQEELDTDIQWLTGGITADEAEEFIMYLMTECQWSIK